MNRERSTVGEIFDGSGSFSQSFALYRIAFSAVICVICVQNI
jgi:hypothetical protein